MSAAYCLLALVAIGFSAFGPRGRKPLRLSASVERALAHPAAVPLAVVALVTAQHAYLHLLSVATYHVQPQRGFMAAMPVRFISSLAPDALAGRFRIGFALLVASEACALVALYYGMAKPARWQCALVAAGTLCACADAVFARAATSADMYSYVGFTLLGTHAYAPPNAAFAGAYAPINVWWHTPLVAAPYGPLWLALADAVASFGHTLFDKIVALRLLGALALVATAAVLAALELPPRIVALVALNPALIFEFVANVHNDLAGVLALLIARYAVARGATRLGIVCAVAAGLVKVPFLVLAALAFAPLGSRRQRLRAYALTLTLGAGASWLAGGRPYLAALRAHVNESTAGHAIASVSGLPGLLKLVALGAVALVLVRGTFVRGGGWALPALGALVHPWYLCWALPYAVDSQTALRNVAVALPIVMLVCDAAIGGGTLADALAGVAAAAFAVSLGRDVAGRFALRDLHA